MKHTILYVAANPLDTERLALDEECAAIEHELRMTSGRDDFDFRSKWAVSVDELMRHLNELQPTILHFSGHGGDGDASSPDRAGAPQHDITDAHSTGILLQDGQSRQYVSDRVLAKLIASATPSTRVVVLNACYGANVADWLRPEVDCVVGMAGAVDDTAARSFAVAFYRALGHRRSIGNAFDQAVATLEAMHPGARPVCATRDGLVAERIFLPTLAAGAPRSPESPPQGSGRMARVKLPPTARRELAGSNKSKQLRDRAMLGASIAAIPTWLLSFGISGGSHAYAADAAAVATSVTAVIVCLVFFLVLAVLRQ